MDREPIPPAAARADLLGQLRRERWHARNAGELRRVAEIDAQIVRLSADNSAAPPTRETTAAAPATAQTTARTNAPKKGHRNVAGRRPQ